MSEAGAVKIKFKHYIEFGLVWTVLNVLRYLPLSLSVMGGRFLIWMYWAIDKRHRRRAVFHARTILGMDEESALAFAKRVYRHYGIMLAEFARLPGTDLRDFEKMVDLSAVKDTWDVLKSSGKGWVAVTAHAGNWEYGGASMGTLGLIEGAIARPIDNPLVNEYIRKIRESTGNRIWDKQGAMRHAMTVLRQGKGFGILLDQDAGLDGWMIPFFGRDASTMPFPAKLAVRQGVPMFAGVLHRVGDQPMRFKLRLCPPRYPEPGADPDVDAKRLLTELNKDLEDLIRMAPEQWLWIHRRWKTSHVGGEFVQDFSY